MLNFFRLFQIITTEWLLRSPHCPYCRCTIIPVDDTAVGQKVDKLTLLQMSKRRAQKAATTYCCVEHGMVRVPAKNTTTKGAGSCRGRQHRDSLLDIVLQPRVADRELVEKRGGRQEGTLLADMDASNNSGRLSSMSGSSTEGASIVLPTGDDDDDGDDDGTNSSSNINNYTGTTVLHPENILPPHALLAQLEAATNHSNTSPSSSSSSASSAVDADDIEAPPLSGASVGLPRTCDEQATSEMTPVGTVLTPSMAAINITASAHGQ